MSSRPTLGDLNEQKPEMSQRHKQRSVRIANPVPGGRNWTSERKARKYVRDKQARMLADGRLWFETTHARASVAAEVRRSIVLSPYDIAASTGLAQIEAIRHIPVSGRPETVLHSRTRRVAPRT